MNKSIVKRVILEANYIIKTQNTVREIAKVFNVSKITVHKYLHESLFEIDKNLYFDFEKILKYHTDIRHIRGGKSTKEKYLNLNN